MTSVPLNDVQSQPLVAELEALRRETHELLLLACELVGGVNDALGKIEPQPPSASELRERALDFLGTAPNKAIREALIRARGPRAASNLATRLGRDLEGRRGRRHPVNGRGAVHHASGNGAALIAAE